MVILDRKKQVQVVSLFQQSPPPKKYIVPLPTYRSTYRATAMASWHPSLPEIVEDQTATGVAIIHGQIARMRIRVEEAILTLAAVLGLATFCWACWGNLWVSLIFLLGFHHCYRFAMICLSKTQIKRAPFRRVDARYVMTRAYQTRKKYVYVPHVSLKHYIIHDSEICDPTVYPANQPKLNCHSGVFNAILLCHASTRLKRKRLYSQYRH